MVNEDLGRKIKVRRKFLGITQRELAEISGLGLRSLVDIESGKGNPTINQLQKVLSVLGLKLEIEINSDE